LSLKSAVSVHIKDGKLPTGSCDGSFVAIDLEGNFNVTNFAQYGVHLIEIPIHVKYNPCDTPVFEMGLLANQEILVEIDNFKITVTEFSLYSTTGLTMDVVPMFAGNKKNKKCKQQMLHLLHHLPLLALALVLVLMLVLIHTLYCRGLQRLSASSAVRRFRKAGHCW
jgi:hypothetical protein